MKIGDLFFAAQLDASGLGIQATKAGDKAGAAAGKSFSSRLSGSLKQGLGIGAGIGAFNLLGTAITKVTGYLGDAANAFREDQVSVQKLTTALRANIEGWDGNTDAIDERIKAGQALGFSDEDQRSSLAELSAAYGDVTKSLDTMRIAEDLARFSGVDLATASATLIKVHAGNYRALKALGINTKGITNETQALAAVQKIAAGQAEDYANTLEGKLAVAEERASEASEKFGQSVARLQAITIPAVTSVVSVAADIFEGFGHAVDSTVPPVTKMDDLLGILEDTGLANSAMFSGLYGDLKDVRQATLDAAAAEKTHGDSLIGVRQAADKALDELDNFPRVFGDIEATAKDAATAVDTFTDSVTDALYGAAIAAGKEQELKDRIGELKDELSKTTDKGDAIKLKGQIAELRQSLFELHLEEAAAIGPEAAIAFLERERKKAGSAKGEIDKLIQSYRTLAGLIVKLPPILRAPPGSRYYGKDLGEPRAGGGPVAAGRPYIVGETRPELFVPDVAGYVHADPARAMAAAAQSGTNGPTINMGGFTIDARGATDPAAVGRAVQQGVGDAMAGAFRDQSLRGLTGTRP